MAINYSNIKKSEGVLISLTSLTQKQFERLQTAFGDQYNKRYSKYNLEGGLRQKRQTVKKTDKLPEIEDKMLFILTYVKAYPIQQVQAQMFDMTQPQCNGWIQRLLPILNDALGQLDLLPEREAGKVGKRLKGEKKLIIDGTERPIQRPKDKDVQKEYYSGKKNAIR
jgi:Helix-turn-helix of DDE superfamily endonuclease